MTKCKNIDLDICDASASAFVRTFLHICVYETYTRIRESIKELSFQFREQQNVVKNVCGLFEMPSREYPIKTILDPVAVAML